MPIEMLDIMFDMCGPDHHYMLMRCCRRWYAVVASLRRRRGLLLLRTPLRVAVTGRQMLEFAFSTGLVRSPALCIAAAARGDTDTLRLAHTELCACNVTATICAAATAGNSPALTCLFDWHGIVYARWSGRRSVFEAAAGAGQLAVMESLRMRGAKINTRIWDRTSPLMAAASHGHLAMVRALIRHGAHVNAKCHEGRMALHRAADV